MGWDLMWMEPAVGVLWNGKRGWPSLLLLWLYSTTAKREEIEGVEVRGRERSDDEMDPRCILHSLFVDPAAVLLCVLEARMGCDAGAFHPSSVYSIDPTALCCRFLCA